MVLAVLLCGATGMTTDVAPAFKALAAELLPKSAETMALDRESTACAKAPRAPNIRLNKPDVRSARLWAPADAKSKKPWPAVFCRLTVACGRVP